MTRKPSLADRARAEMREYAIIVVYLYVCFAALLLFKDSILHAEGVAYLPVGFAAIKALILGKFVLIGDQARLGSRLKSRTLLELISRTAFAYLLWLVVLTVVEELVVGWIHGQSFAATVAEFGRHSSLGMLATVILMLFIMVPFVAVREISRALGPGVLIGLLRAPPGRDPDSK